LRRLSLQLVAQEGFGTPVMEFEFRCVNCEALLRLRGEAAGKRIKCPRCEAVQVAPGGPAPMAEPPQGPRPARITPPDDEELILADIPKPPPYRPELAEPPVPVAKLVSSSSARPQKGKTPPPSTAKPKPPQAPAAKQVPVARLAPPQTSVAKPAQAPLRPAQWVQPPVAQELSPLAALENLRGDALMSGPSIEGVKPAYDFPKLPSEPEPAPTPVRRVYTDKPRRKKGGVDAMTILKIPAIMLMIYSGLMLGLTLLSGIGWIWVTICVASGSPVPFGQQPPDMTIYIFTNIISDLISILVNFVILRGAWCMVSGYDYTSARNGAILAAIPCCGFLCFPFGIWAFIMLSMESVKDAFD
jgi:hypothetical protein